MACRTRSWRNPDPDSSGPTILLADPHLDGRLTSGPGPGAGVITSRVPADAAELSPRGRRSAGLGPDGATARVGRRLRSTARRSLPQSRGLVRGGDRACRCRSAVAIAPKSRSLLGPVGFPGCADLRERDSCPRRLLGARHLQGMSAAADCVGAVPGGPGGPHRRRSGPRLTALAVAAGARTLEDLGTGSATARRRTITGLADAPIEEPDLVQTAWRLVNARWRRRS